jgi:serine dehydratase beta subunit
MSRSQRTETGLIVVPYAPPPNLLARSVLVNTAARMVSVGGHDLFKIGAGLSSSHTVGPMLAAEAFIRSVRGIWESVVRIDDGGAVSLVRTAKGPATDEAIVLDPDCSEHGNLVAPRTVALARYQTQQ